MSKRQKLYLAGIFILAAGLRCIAINSRNIQYDDAFSFFISRISLNGIIQATAADTMPPLYYYLLHFWQLISTQIWFLRGLSVLFSLGAIAFLFLLIKRSVNITAGLWAGLFSAISPLQLYHAQDIRMYALLAFCGMGYAYYLFRCWEDATQQSKDLGYWMGVIGFGTAAMYTHNLAVFWIISPVVFFLIKRNWNYLWKFIGSLAMIGLFFSPWLVQLPGQIQKIQNAFWTPRPGIIEVFQAVLQYSFHLPSQSQLLFYIGAIIGLEMFVLVIIRVFANLKIEPNFLFLLILAFVSPLLIFLASYFIRPVFVARGFIPAQLAFLGLAGGVTAIDWKRKIGVVVAILIGVNALISLPVFYSFAEFPRSPFASAAGILQQDIDQGFIVIHDNKLSYFPTSYYLDSPSQTFLKDEPGSANDTFAVKSQDAMGIHPLENISDAVSDHQKVVLVVFREAINEYSPMNKTHPVIQWMKENFTLEKTQAIGDLELMYFVRPVK
jgi:mannosyltransferase